VELTFMAEYQRFTICCNYDNLCGSQFIKMARLADSFLINGQASGFGVEVI
jgi:hypothetical protein